MDQINFDNFNGNEGTFTEFDFEYPGNPAPDSVQFERNEKFTMMNESFTHNNHKNTNITSSSSSIEQPNSDDNLVISPPFPPNIDPKALAQELFNKGGKRTKKMLNEFFLFRKEFVRELKKQNLHPRQTKVSSLASASWHKQQPSVKDEYRRLAREVERLFMIERQREINETSRVESNESSTDDSVSSPTEPKLRNPNNYQLPLLSNQSSDNISNFLESNNQNNVRRNYLPFYQDQPPLSWPYNQYDRQNIRQTNDTDTTSFRHLTTSNYFQAYDDQVVVPSQNSQEYFTSNYSR